jgi:hypothetical protein
MFNLIVTQLPDNGALAGNPYRAKIQKGGTLSDSQQPRPQLIHISALTVEEGVEELLASPNMQPYLEFAKTVISGGNADDELREISELPLEKRYTWRVASALKWAFADLDELNVRADLETLADGDLQKISDLLRYRPMQFCLFLAAVSGTEAMEQMMTRAIDFAKNVSTTRS